MADYRMSGEDELLVRRVQKVWRACRIRRKFRALIRAKRALQTTCSVKSAWGKERSRNGWAKLKLGTKAGRAIVHTRELLRIREQSLVRIAQSQAIVEASAASGIDLASVLALDARTVARDTVANPFLLVHSESAGRLVRVSQSMQISDLRRCVVE